MTASDQDAEIRQPYRADGRAAWRDRARRAAPQHWGGAELRCECKILLGREKFTPGAADGNVFKWCFFIHKPQLSITGHDLSYFGQLFGLFKRRV